MNYNQIQALLEKLPDEQIMAFVQGSNPQVPQILAQMEAMRRETLRKSETMRTPGVTGMATGGAVRKFAEGGPVTSYRKRQEREEEKLEEAKRKRTLAMREPGGPAYAIGNVLESGIGALRNVGSAVANSAPVQAVGAAANAVGDNFDRTQERRMRAEANTRASEVLAQGPTEFQQGAVPAASAAPDARAAEVLAQGPTEFQTSPQVPAVQPMAPPPVQGGIASLAPEQAPARAPTRPAVAQNPQATPEVLGKIAQATDAQAAKFADQYRDIFAERAAARESGRSNKPDADLDRKQAFYYALAKFGATLATTGIWAQAGDVGLEAFRGELEKSTARQEAFRKESLEIGMAALDDKLAALGVDERQRAAMRAEGQSAIDNSFKQKEVDIKERDLQQRGDLGRAQIAASREEARLRSSGGVGALGAKPMTYEQALEKAQTEREKNPLIKAGTLEQRALELMRIDPARTGTLGAPTPGIGLDPSAIAAELARRSAK